MPIPAKRVKNMITGEIFPSAKAAADSVGLTADAIRKGIKSLTYEPAGFKWGYVNEEE